jgi:hypothetical protein
MAQDLTVNIKTTSDVPKAMEKSKTAVVSFSKQIEDIQKKFSTAFKDIFLGFTAPMVILNTLVGAISDRIAEAKRSAQEGFDLIASGETKFATSEEKKFANFLKVKAAMEKEQKDVEEGKIEMTRKFLETEAGKKFLEQEARDSGRRRQLNPNVAVHYESVRKAAMDAFLNSEEGKKFKPLFEDKEAEKKAGTFKGPEGFGTVIGVGANPVMEKMTRNNEILEEIKIILQEQSIQNRTGQGVPPPFTDRVVPLSAAKEGVA